MSATFWVTFGKGITYDQQMANPSTGQTTIRKHLAVCVEAMDDDDCRTFVTEKFGVTDPVIQALPYPASPRFASSEAAKSECPSFCRKPGECAGHTSCPQSHSCTE